MEDEEALQTRAVVGESAQLIHHGVDELLSDGVVTTGIYNARISESKKDKGVNIQLFAASSLPVIMVSGWKRDLYGPVLTSSIAPGSRSM